MAGQNLDKLQVRRDSADLSSFCCVITGSYIMDFSAPALFKNRFAWNNVEF